MILTLTYIMKFVIQGIAAELTGPIDKSIHAKYNHNPWYFSASQDSCLSHPANVKADDWYGEGQFPIVSVEVGNAVFQSS